MPRALITGITGQDGSYLAELLILKGYDVHGVIRRSSSFNTGRINHIYDRLHLHHGDMTDAHCLSALVREVRPDEVYNLAAQSHVGVSFGAPAYTMDATGVGTLRLLEAIRDHAPGARFYQASSSEMFGNSEDEVQSERTVFRPASPYACAKVYAHHATVNYRESYGMHASCGILFNHESPRRGETFVTRKITRAVAAIKSGEQERLVLGNLDARRDWGFAGDYVEAMWRMLQLDKPGDYVVATGVSTSVRDFARLAFRYAGLDWADHVDVSDRYRRPSDVHLLCGDAAKAAAVLGWRPTVGVDCLVEMMMEADMEALR